MPEEFRDCPLGEIPTLPPELISVLHDLLKGAGLGAPGRGRIGEDPAGRVRSHFAVSDQRCTGMDLRCYTDTSYYAVLGLDDEVAGLLVDAPPEPRPRVHTPSMAPSARLAGLTKSESRPAQDDK